MAVVTVVAVVAVMTVRTVRFLESGPGWRVTVKLVVGVMVIWLMLMGFCAFVSFVVGRQVLVLVRVLLPLLSFCKRFGRQLFQVLD